jgi:hypothetical protein
VLPALERNNRICKRLASFLGVAFGGFAFLGAVATSTVQKTIEAERFTVKDSAGNPRASWGVGADGGVTLGMTEKNGKTRLTLTVEPNGSPVLYFYGKGGTRKFLLNLNNSDSPELILFDRQEKKRLGLVVDETKGSAGIIISDSLERRRATFLVTDEGLPGILFLGDKEENQMLLAQSKNGPVFTISDRNKNPRIIFGSLSQGPSLRFYDEKGALVRAIP